MSRRENPRRSRLAVSFAILTAVLLGIAAPAPAADGPSAATAPSLDHYTVDGERIELRLSTEWIALREAPGFAADDPVLAAAAEWERLPIGASLARVERGTSDRSVRGAIARLRRE